MAKRSRHFTQHACRALYSEKSRAFGQGFTESVNLCCDLLRHDSDFITYNECKLTREQFCKPLSFAVKDNHFTFNKQLYDQIDSVTMGSPLRPSLANTSMCALEKMFLDNCPSEFKPILYRRYVDDTFCFLCNKHPVEK